MVSGPSGARQRIVGACDPPRSTCFALTCASALPLPCERRVKVTASVRPSAFRLPVARSNRRNRSRLQSLHAYASSRLDRICPRQPSQLSPFQPNFSPVIFTFFPRFFTLLFRYPASYLLEQQKTAVLSQSVAKANSIQSIDRQVVYTRL